ncbi:choice-of-anchor I family protein [Endozoicomonas numazuensis]|uniref:choice-of-anchor I family protein n=1 Tax=Endozoicomonas numazuensis TaxID=1137799 RepID=UPI00068CF725|nr:choice-of-anchor I family protein [Endozoicomonas numazuensis]
MELKLARNVFLLAAPFVLAGCSTVQETTEITHPTMEPIGRYASGSFHKGAAEIVAWHNASQSIYVVNASDKTVDILSGKSLKGEPLANPTQDSNLLKIGKINLQSSVDEMELGAANSVAVYGDLLAVAVENSNKQKKGVIILYKLDAEGGAVFSDYKVVGALPDMVSFTPNGQYLLSANEGEPSFDYKHDPEGSVSVIKVTSEGKLEEPRHATFTAFNKGHSRNSELPDDVRVFGRDASVAQDLEPEYIAVSDNSNIAYVSLQENNALAVIDIANARVDSIVALGYKDYGQSPIDASNKDGGVNLQKWSGVYGMYQPDTIATYSVEGKTYVVTANEGDARDYWYKAASEDQCLASGGLKYDDEDGCLGFSEEVRTKKVKVDLEHPNADAAKDKKKLARLKITNTLGDIDNDGQFEQLYSYGARSFSIWNEEGELVYDSGSDFEEVTAAVLGENFNNNDEETKGDNRSDDKGPEPEALALGEVDGRQYAFIGLERTGGVLMYDVTNPAEAEFISYVYNRDFSVDTEKEPQKAGDVSPEGMKFVDAGESPTGKPLLIIGHEVSGSTLVYQID